MPTLPCIARTPVDRLNERRIDNGLGLRRYPSRGFSQFARETRGFECSSSYPDGRPVLKRRLAPIRHRRRLDQTKSQQTVPASSIRETINLLESDLGAMIGEVYRACELVRHEAGDSATAVHGITEKTVSLISQADAASRDLKLLAAATDELARASDNIGNQVRKADDLTGFSERVGHDGRPQRRRAQEVNRGNRTRRGPHFGGGAANQPAGAQRDDRVWRGRAWPAAASRSSLPR